MPSPLADWATRALGFLVDWAPVFIVSLLTYRVSFFFNILSIAYIAYLGHLDGVSGQTPGKAIMGTRVVNLQGQLIGSGAGIGRKFAHILDSLICGLGYLLPLVDAKRQTIADKVMTTFVVTGLEKKSFSLDLWKPPPTTTT
ncbi:MAG TPA: RDD family protein [Acidimicrobiia bacterium]